MIQLTGHWYRGGTSKCWFFDRRDMDATGFPVEVVLSDAFGAHDHRQIDGVGGGTSTTSKAAVITPYPGPEADVSYLFAQVGIGDGRVEFGSNCGNCASAVGLYAIQRGLVVPTGDVTEVRMYNENSHSVLIARVGTPGGQVPWTGSDLIPGHDAPGVAVDLGFETPAGRSTGHLLPTGHAFDELVREDGMLIGATLIDAGAPAVLIPALDLGLSAREALDDFAAHVPELKLWQRQAALQMGLRSPDDPVSDAIPKVGVVGHPDDYETTRGEVVAGSDYDVAVRMVSMHAPHPAIGMTSAVAVAAAAGVPGSSVARILPSAPIASGGTRTVRIGTPTGVITTSVTTTPAGDISLVTTRRVARRIAEATIDLTTS